MDMSVYWLYGLIGMGCLGGIWLLIKIGFFEAIFDILGTILESLTD
jgi:hypothetical protein